MQKKIASIYFSAVKAGRPLYGGDYKVPAVERGAEPFVLVVTDKVQRSQEPSADGKTKTTRRDLINGRDIAADIMREWTRETVGMTPECCPGIWIVRDELPIVHDGSDPKYPAGTPQFDADGAAMWRPATASEAAQMWAEDMEAARVQNSNWGDYLIRQGDVLAEDPKQWVMISSLMRTACHYFGRERDWLQELKDSDIKHCAYCTKTVPAQAIKCPFCHEVVDQERYADMKANEASLIEAAAEAQSASRARAQAHARQQQKVTA